MPQPDQSRPVHVVQLTDAHLFADSAGSMLGLNTRDSLRHVVAQVRREQPLVDLLLCTGDLSQDASVASYEAFRELTAPFAVPTRWLPGNHDEPSHGASGAGAGTGGDRYRCVAHRHAQHSRTRGDAWAAGGRSAGSAGSGLARGG